MDIITESIMKFDLENLSREQINILHDLKAKALGEWAKQELARMKREAA